MLKSSIAKASNRGKYGLWFIIMAAVGLIAYGAWGLWRYYYATHSPTLGISTNAVSHSTQQPDETPPDCSDKYVVADKDPRQIELPSIKKSGCIQSVGIDQNTAIAVPSNVHLAGWYINSVRPGELGVSLIDGHISGRYSDAIFTGLDKIQPGQVIRIQFGDMSWKEFSVRQKEIRSANETAEVMMQQTQAISRQLTLISCGGRFNTSTQQYEDRVIVRAEVR